MPDWIMPVKVVRLREFFYVKWRTWWSVIGSDDNATEWCRCSDEETARYIACAINKMPRAPIGSVPQLLDA